MHSPAITQARLITCEPAHELDPEDPDLKYALDIVEGIAT